MPRGSGGLRSLKSRTLHPSWNSSCLHSAGCPRSVTSLGAPQGAFCRGQAPLLPYLSACIPNISRIKSTVAPLSVILST